MDVAATYRLDGLRRFATALASASGLTPSRASALATHLLWFDAAGASTFGIATLADLLGRVDSGDIDPKTEGAIRSEHAATLTLDAKHGVAPLILARAAALSAEKARDVGVGLVRVVNLGPAGPAACVVAEAAIGPELAIVLGPGRHWALAVPSPEGLPLVIDTALGGISTPPPDALAPWTFLATEDGWLVAAVAIRAFEPLATFHERVASALRGIPDAPGRFSPASWEAHRRTARERGVVVEPSAMERLLRRAEGLGIPPPHG